MYTTNTDPERIVGQFRRSIYTFGFWWRTLFTFGLYPLVIWPRNTVTLTNRRLMQRTWSLVASREVWINIEHVTDVRLRITPLGQLFGFGDISIQSFAGSHNAEIIFAGLDGAARLRDMIFRLQDAIRGAIR